MISVGAEALRYDSATAVLGTGIHQLRSNDGSLRRKYTMRGSRTSTDWLVILGWYGIQARTLVDLLNGASIEGDVFPTHHWDHILVFRSLRRSSKAEITLRLGLEDARDEHRSRGQDDVPVVFPVTFEELDARIDFVRSPRRRTGWLRRHGVQRSAPGGALGYRLRMRALETERGGVRLSRTTSSGRGNTRRGTIGGTSCEIRWGAKLLVHDTTYVGQYEQHRGWGHSTFEDAIGLALEAEVGSWCSSTTSERTDDDGSVRGDAQAL